MPIDDHCVWLIWASAFLIPWLMIYAGLPRFRAQMLFGFTFGMYWSGVYEHFTWTRSTAAAVFKR